MKAAGPSIGQSAAVTHRVTLLDVVAASTRNAPLLPAQLRALPTVLQARSDRPRSIGWMLERNARRFGARPAVVTYTQTLTWRNLNRAANRYAHALNARGVRSGQSVALLAPTSVELLVMVAALAKLGAVAALLNTRQSGRVLGHSLRVAGAHAVVVTDELAPVLSDVEDGADFETWPLPDLTAEAAQAPSWDPDSTRRVRLPDPAFTIFTSGTTGLPKASVMTHMRWIKAAAVYGQVMLRLRPTDVVYVPLPFFHNMALTSAWSACCHSGAALAIAPKFSASSFWADCKRFGATAFPYIGEIPRYLLARPPSPQDRDHLARKCFGVGMRSELWRPFQERFGIEEIYEHYSASEANTMFLNPLRLPGTVGFCVTPHRLLRYDVDEGRIVRDGRGRPIKARRGEAGLLVCRISDRFQFDGYTDPEASEAKLLRDLFEPGDTWFDSGDLLRKVGWGHAVFVDRVGDTFRWKSENVSTGEVEAIVGVAPGVDDCAVYGVLVPERSGRAGMAAVVPGPGFDADALLAHLRAELPSYAVPVFLRVVEQLETTGTHKHRKADLKRHAFDPSLVGSDPLYVALAGDDTWTPVTTALFAELGAGEHRL